MLSTIPDDFAVDDLTYEQQDAINNIDAIEQEWIVDPIQRAQLSVLGWDDDDDDEENQWVIMLIFILSILLDSLRSIALQ